MFAPLNRLGLRVNWLRDSVRVPPDHQTLLGKILIKPPNPSAMVEVMLIYVGQEAFKSNPSPTPHSAWAFIETISAELDNLIGVVDIWTITPSGVSPVIYTVEVSMMELVGLNFTIFGHAYRFPPAADPGKINDSGLASGYWVAQVKETGEIGNFI